MSSNDVQMTFPEHLHFVSNIDHPRGKVSRKFRHKAAPKKSIESLWLLGAYFNDHLPSVRKKAESRLLN